MQAFDFDVVHRKGDRMSHVDYLSRNPLPNSTVKVVEKFETRRVDFNQLTDNWLIAEQQRDPKISKLISDLTVFPKISRKFPEDISRTYEMRSDVLHRKIQRNGRSRLAANFTAST